MTISWAQQSEITIHAIDLEDGKDVPFCHVCIRDLGTDHTDYFLTDEQGKASFAFSGKAVISISFMGYKTIIDTIADLKNTIKYEMEPQSFEFSEVIVTGQNKPISVDKSIYNIKLIGKKEIEQTASPTLSQLLNKQVNIQIKNDPSTGSSLKMQGITGENVKILVDGVPMIGRLNGNIDLSQIYLADVDHIEIVEGPMSVIYGSNALGGVINIITKENKYANFKAGADLYYESVGVYNVNANAYWKKNAHSGGGNFGRNFFDGYSIEPGSRSMQWKPKEQYNASLHYIYSTNKLKLKAKVDAFKERLLDRNNPSPPYYIYANDTWFYTDRINSSLHGDYQLSDLNSFKTMFSYSYYDRTKEKYFKDLSTLESWLSSNPDDLDTSVFNSVVARGVYNRHTMSEVLEYQMGFDINWEDARGKRIYNKYEKMADYAAFLVIKWKINERLMLQPALRASYNSKYKAPLVPSVNVKYSWRKNSLRMSYAGGFRAPSLKELYLYFYDSNHKIEGNPNLEAENSHNFNLAYNGNALIKEAEFGYQLTAFYNQIFNKIALVQIEKEGELIYRNENIDKYESLGGVFSINMNPIRNLSLDFAVASTGIRDNSSGLSNFYFSTDATSSLSYSFIENTANISVFYKYIGAYPNYIYLEDGGIGISYQEDYHNMDINLSKKFFQNSLTISAGVKNIFDNKQLKTSGASGGSGHGSSSASSNLVGWGRTVFVGLNYNFAKYKK